MPTLAPANAVALVFSDTMADDETLRLQSEQPLREVADIVQLRFDFTANRANLEDAALLDRLARFADDHHAAVLPPRDAATLAVDHSVIITGAADPTASSCPSREQTTPG